MKKRKNIIALLSLMFTLSLTSSQREIEDNNRYIFDNSIISEYNIDTLNSYVLQGICNANKHTLVTAYDANGNNSKIYIFDENFNLLDEKELYNSSHVGGITYDPNHQIVWITDINGTISGYRYKDIIIKDFIEPIYKQIDVSDKLTNIYGTRAIAYVTYYNNHIYVGNFNLFLHSHLKEYAINDDGNIDMNTYNDYQMPSWVQGITFFDDNNQTYLATSSSFGRINNSKLRIVKFDRNIDDFNQSKYVELKLPPMMEQIIIKDNILTTIFESNADKYKTKRHTVSDIVNADLEDIINNNIKTL